MQLIRKMVKGHAYWYLVQKGRKNGVRYQHQDHLHRHS